MLLENKVAIISGAAVGMGKGMALRFAQEGCAIVAADINAEGVNSTVTEIKQSGGKGIAVTCDVTDIKQVEQVVEQAIQQYGQVDILINNAGGISKDIPPVEGISEEEWDRVFQLNLKSVFFFTKFVIPHMKKRKYGKIVNISSIGAIQPPHHVSHYNTAKSAIIGFTADLAIGAAPHNINVNTILPGPIRTEFYSNRTDVMNNEEKDKFFAFLGTKVPLQRVGTVDDIAGAALFFASELSSWITGQALNVAGGLPLPIPVPDPKE